MNRTLLSVMSLVAYIAGGALLGTGIAISIVPMMIGGVVLLGIGGVLSFNIRIF
jgi:hypothetical protein